jgi:hypothetical protein
LKGSKCIVFFNTIILVHMPNLVILLPIKLRQQYYGNIVVLLVSFMVKYHKKLKLMHLLSEADADRSKTDINASSNPSILIMHYYIHTQRIPIGRRHRSAWRNKPPVDLVPVYPNTCGATAIDKPNGGTSCKKGEKYAPPAGIPVFSTLFRPPPPVCPMPMARCPVCLRLPEVCYIHLNAQTG